MSTTEPTSVDWANMPPENWEPHERPGPGPDVGGGGGLVWPLLGVALFIASAMVGYMVGDMVGAAVALLR